MVWPAMAADEAEVEIVAVTHAKSRLFYSAERAVRLPGAGSCLSLAAHFSRSHHDVLGGLLLLRRRDPLRPERAGRIDRDRHRWHHDRTLDASFRGPFGRRALDGRLSFASDFGRDVKPYGLLELWEAETAALSTRSNTGMGVTNDIGNVGDIHRRTSRRSAGGCRCGHWPRRKANRTWCTPAPHIGRWRSGTAPSCSSSTTDGLTTRDGEPPDWFEIAGDDPLFVEAAAADAVVVSIEAVRKPAAVRLAWHMVAEPNLVNGAGLQAIAFRTQQEGAR